MAIPRSQTSSLDVLSVMARLLGPAQSPNLPMVPFPQDGFGIGGSIGGRSSGGGGRSGGSSSPYGLEEVTGAANGEPGKLRPWNTLGKDAASFRLNVEGQFPDDLSGVTPEELQQAANLYGVDASTVPRWKSAFAPKAPKAPPTSDEQFSEAARIKKQLDDLSIPDGKRPDLLRQYYPQMDPSLVLAGTQGATKAGGASLSVTEIKNFRELQRTDPPAAALWAKQNGVELPELSEASNPDVPTGKANDELADILLAWPNATPAKQAELRDRMQELGRDPDKVLGVTKSDDEAWQAAMFDRNGEFSEAGRKLRDETRTRLAGQQESERVAWLESETARIEAMPATTADELAEKEKQFEAMEAESASRRKATVSDDQVGLATYKQWASNRTSAKLEQDRPRRSFMGPQLDEVKINDPAAEAAAMQQGREESLQRDPGDGWAYNQSAPPPPQDAFTVASQKFEGVMKSLDSPESQEKHLGWNPQSRDEADFMGQEKRVTDLQKMIRANRSGQQGRASLNLIKEFIKEVGTLEEMAGKRKSQPTMQQRAESETYAMPDGMRIFPGPTGEWKSIMPPKSNVQVETQRLEFDREIAAERLRFDRERQGFEQRKLEFEQQHRGRELDARDAKDLRDKIFDLSTQPAEPMPQIAPSELPGAPPDDGRNALDGIGPRPQGVPGGVHDLTGPTRQDMILQQNQTGISGVDTFGAGYKPDALVTFDPAKLPAKVKSHRIGKPVIALRQKFAGRSEADLTVQMAADVVLDALSRGELDPSDPQILEAVKMLSLAGLNIGE